MVSRKVKNTFVTIRRSLL